MSIAFSGAPIKSQTRPDGGELERQRKREPTARVSGSERQRYSGNATGDQPNRPGTRSVYRVVWEGRREVTPYPDIQKTFFTLLLSVSIRLNQLIVLLSKDHIEVEA